MKTLLFIFLINFILTIAEQPINLLPNLLPRKYLIILILYILNTHILIISIIHNIHNKDNIIKNIWQSNNVSKGLVISEGSNTL